MQAVFVSRGSYRRGKELAECVATRLGCRCVAREDLVEGATQHGIPVGKLEEAVLKRRPMNETLHLLAARYKAYTTATLGAYMLEGDLVYHGRAGRLALPGVPHILRVRALTDAEDRYEGVISRLKLSREKAILYVEQIDDDLRRWVRTLYNLDIADPALFNLTVNCSNLAAGNLATAIVNFVQLPDFQASPASIRHIENILLAARSRLALADDERTRDLDVQVRADTGRVAVTYLPRQAKRAEAIPLVLEGVAGIRELRQTIASTTIVWVQERFDPASETMRHVLDVAERWEAAVDLVRMLPEGPDAESQPDHEESPSLSIVTSGGGILDDVIEEDVEADDGGVKATLDHLIRAGRAGTRCTINGGNQALIGSVCGISSASLLVIDNVFLDKGTAVRKRLTRDLASHLSDRLRVPVVGAEELKTQYVFGRKQWLELAVTLGLTTLLYVLVFTHQEAVLEFLRSQETIGRFLAVTAVAVTAPLVAYLWGTAAHHLLLLARFE